MKHTMEQSGALLATFGTESPQKVFFLLLAAHRYVYGLYISNAPTPSKMCRLQLTRALPKIYNPGISEHMAYKNPLQQ